MTQSSYAIDSSTPLGSAADAITLVQGGTFLVCAPDLSITPGGMQGLYASDTRVLSGLAITINRRTIFGLSHSSTNRSAYEVGTIGDPSRPTFLVTRELTLFPEKMGLSLEITNLESFSAELLIDLTVQSDFADIFDVKRGEMARGGFVGGGASNGALVLAYENAGFRRGVRISADQDYEILRDGLRLSAELGPRDRFRVSVAFVPEAQRYAEPIAVPGESCDVSFRKTSLHLLNRENILRASYEDLESLLIRDPVTKEWIIAAGSPWFLTLFGRDSLIASIQTMSLGTNLAMNVLRALAHRQGKSFNEATDEQPGRILHEMRSGEAVERPGGWGDVYYGSVDATPLFIIALAEALRWGAPHEEVRALMPAAELAYQWITDISDVDGDGFIEYPGKALRTGLDNQGWKDSYDAIRHPNGDLAQGPIAVVEVQGYKHAALLALAFLRQELGEGSAQTLFEEAEELRAKIHDAFWIESQDCFALALDGNKQRVESITSNAGHLLWTGTVSEDRAPRLARRLLEPDMFTGFGIRTLSSQNAGWNPLSYHCGTVWPHDSALIAAGMFRYGLLNEALQLTNGLLDAAGCCSNRLPELFAGFDREEFNSPVPYPSSCSPQAWAAGAPIMLTHALIVANRQHKE